MTQAIHKYQLYPFWNNEYTALTYIHESFNDHALVATWRQQGYMPKFTGDMCDMRNPQPSWNQRFVEMFEGQGWRDVGTSYYRMNTGTVLPTHSDLYLKYIELFNLRGREHTIRRAIVFLEDWKSGHYLEVEGTPFVKWSAGDYVIWKYDAEHYAANIGQDPRYTMQITGIQK